MIELDENIRKNGLKNEELNSLASFAYHNQLKDKDNSCSICLGDYVRNEKITAIACFHKFHQKCIIEWLMVNKNYLF